MSALASDELSVGSAGMSAMHVTALQRITQREALTIADIEKMNEQAAQGRLDRAREALDAELEEADDVDEFMDMDEAKSDGALPAAAAAVQVEVNNDKKRARRGAAITLQQIANAMYADDVTNDAIIKWNQEGAKLQRLREAAEALGSFTSNAGKISRVAEDVPAYALGPDRRIKIPDSVSPSGLGEREQSADIAAADVGKVLNQIVKLIDVVEDRLYKTAKCNLVLRHYRKKVAAQEKVREIAAAEKAATFLRLTQSKMESNGAYQDRQLDQAEVRQKVSTNEGKRKSRFNQDKPSVAQ
jgi:hypothetical protein